MLSVLVRSTEFCLFPVQTVDKTGDIPHVKSFQVYIDLSISQIV